MSGRDLVCHFFVCTNARPDESPLPSCGPRGGEGVFEAFRRELARRGWPPGVKVTPTGCLTPCQHGPNVVVYPQGTWYAGVSAWDVPALIAAHLERGEALDRLRLPADVRLW